MKMERGRGFLYRVSGKKVSLLIELIVGILLKIQLKVKPCSISLE